MINRAFVRNFGLNCREHYLKENSNPTGMRTLEELTFIELVDKLAVTTEKYTKILKEDRNSDEHVVLRDEIQQIIREIDRRRSSDQSPSSNPSLPGHQFLFIKDA